MARARTFDLLTGEKIEVEIEKGMGTRGLFIVVQDGKRMTRHRNQLEALDEAASDLLKSGR